MTSFTVMTWNVENLFPVGSASGPETDDVYRRKLDNIAAVVRSIRPHVLALQEIGTLGPLADLQARLDGKYPHVRVSSHPDPRGIRVGFLSRRPLTKVEEVRDFPDGCLTNVPNADGRPIARLGRGALKVSVNAATGVTVHLLNVHLKSKLLTYPGGRRFPRDENERARGAALALMQRAAEAVAVRVFANRLTTGNQEPLIVVGDLNDVPDAVTTQTILGPEDLDVHRPDQGDDTRLYNLAEFIPESRRYSRIYRRRGELIDHICVSRELLFARRQVDSFVEPITGIDESVERRRDATFPDHAPVYARFEL